MARNTIELTDYELSVLAEAAEETWERWVDDFESSDPRTKTLAAILSDLNYRQGIA